jgi:sialic acid synthase SpsE
MSFQIGGKTVTPERPLIIAEIGSNWLDLDECLTSIRRAAACGADAVKFQMFNFRGLYGKDEKSKPTWYNKKHELPVEWLPSLRAEADNSGVELMISCFSPDLLPTVDPYVHCHKIASSELTNIDMVEKVADYGKPIFVSCGGAAESQITTALTALSGCMVILNYCVAAYPAKHANLFIINELKKFGYPVGFSDHSMDYVYLPQAALRLHGAVCLEKHVTFVNHTTPDSHHSLKPHEFKMMVDYIRGRRRPMVGPVSEEIEFLSRHKRRMVATDNIKKGEEFLWGTNVGAYRAENPSDDVVSPFLKVTLEGKFSVRDISVGSSIKPTDFV